MPADHGRLSSIRFYGGVFYLCIRLRTLIKFVARIVKGLLGGADSFAERFPVALMDCIVCFCRSRYAQAR